MHIRRVTVHGFKSYDDTVVFGPFEPGKNALVGLNGTGKSNFYSAIGFVLLDEYAHIRVADRKALLHEGQGQSAMTAYVEIVFDNKARKIPIENDEVSIRRSIGLKKDEYFIDRKNSTRQDVHNLLESCGFSPSSGYYIVRQGKVNALALMKDTDRLELLYEIAGTKFYDQQREESVKMIAESSARTEKITDSLNYIQERLSQLDEEKKELEELESLDKERRAVEYLIQSNEIKKINDQLSCLEDERRQVSDAANSLQEEYDVNHSKLKEQQERLKDNKSVETQYTIQKDKAESRKHEYIRVQTRTEIKEKDLENKMNNVEQIRSTYEKKLKQIESSLEEKTAQLNEVNEELSKVSTDKAAEQGKLDGLKQIVGNKIQDTASTEDELNRAKKIYENLKKQEKVDLTNLEEAKKRLNNLENNKTEIDSQLNVKYEAQRESKEERNRLLNEKKELWRDEDRLEREDKRISHLIEKLSSKMNSAMPVENMMAMEAIKKMNVDGVYSQIYNLIECPEEYATAVNVVGKGKLFYVVVESDEIGKNLIDKLTKDQSGRVSFIPLNKIEKSKAVLPDGVNTLVSQLTFDKKFSKAIDFVFGKTLVAENANEAAQLMTKYNFDVVTKDGDFFSSHGPISGGSRSTNMSPIAIAALITKKEKKLAEIQAELKESKERLADIENQSNDANNGLQNAKNDCFKLESDKVALQLKVSDLKEEIESKSRQFERLQKSVEEAERNLISIEERYKFIQNYNAKSDVAKQQKELIESRHRYDELTRQYSQLCKQRVELSSEINDSLRPRRRRLIDDIEGLDFDKISFQLKNVKRENEIATKNFEDACQMVDQIEEKLSEAVANINAAEKEITSLQKEEDRVSKRLTGQKNKIEQLRAQISLNQQRVEECIKQQRDIGALNETEIDEFKGQSRSELMRQLANINQECQRFRHVNKKAIEQHHSFTQQQVELTMRQQELNSSRESITTLIAKLDERKNIAIAHTFQMISENFAQILNDLDPMAKGQLVLQTDEETNQYTGVSIKAQFGDMDVVTLAQLSGGQKALIALTFVFAIQKYAPAPFYLFDEVDSALDDKYRLAVSNLMDMYCKSAEGENRAQIIFTTFKKELLNNCDKYFAVKYDRGHSSAVEITENDANSIIAEQNDN